MRKIIDEIFMAILLILFIFYIFNPSEVKYQEQLDGYKTDVQRMQLEVEMLRLEQQELTKQVREFIEKWNVDVFEATAYAPADNKSGMCADSNPLLTATGTRPGPGTIAVNPKVVPYQSNLWVQGYGWGQALDTGGMIRARDDLIDVFKWTYEDAMKWGRRKVVVVWSPGQTEY
ncbi:MAG: hypothetical protein JM58_09130 [Peptococcaceae bacterium BICA1-8]|nr:MAG: hypothetical protein JM58_09130 [Peptococcaceae bacterium BICA1-8]